MNGELVTSESDVPADTSQWIITDPEKDSHHLSEYEIEAVGSAATRKSNKQSLMIRGSKPKTKVPAPQNLQVSLIKKDKEQFAKITWDQVDFEKQGVLVIHLILHYLHKPDKPRNYLD